MMQREISNIAEIPAGDVVLESELIVPANANGIVLFVHGSGSSRFSPRNRSVAEMIQTAGIGTLLFDLLTKEEESVDIYTLHLRFDIPLLARRLKAVSQWVNERAETEDLKVGYFGSSTGGGAALVAAADLGNKISAVVSRGGRPDLAGEALSRVTAPTALIVGEYDQIVIELNRDAMSKMKCKTELMIVPGATHLFEEPGTLDFVAKLATDWFTEHFRPEAKSTVG
jgi:putative phosphoribosyl transferase